MEYSCLRNMVFFSAMLCLFSELGLANDCPSTRSVKDGDAIFLTIDDGPSDGSRVHLLKAFKEAGAKVTFFESGYNLCNDLNTPNCQKSSYESNAKMLAQTVKDGHMLASHSDNHYYDPQSGKCTYLKVKPQVRPPQRIQICGEDPIQNMVQGTYQIQQALMSKHVKWDSQEEKNLQKKAIDDVWTYSRLPCSDIWRTRGQISETNLPGVTNKQEIALRSKIADDMFSGDVKCRPKKYKGTPWENYGFDSDVDWKGDKVLEKGEACRIVKLIESNIASETSAQKKGKLVLLTHDYFFNSEEKANVFGAVAKDLIKKGYKLKTIDQFHPKIDGDIPSSVEGESSNQPKLEKKKLEKKTHNEITQDKNEDTDLQSKSSAANMHSFPLTYMLCYVVLVMIINI